METETSVPGGDNCYENSEGNQQMFPHSVWKTRCVLWETQQCISIFVFIKIPSRSNLTVSITELLLRTTKRARGDRKLVSLLIAETATVLASRFRDNHFMSGQALLSIRTLDLNLNNGTHAWTCLSILRCLKKEVTLLWSTFHKARSFFQKSLSQLASGYR